MPKSTDQNAVRKSLEKYRLQRKSFASRFAAAVPARAKLRPAAFGKVVRWEYFTSLAAHLNPGYFVMEHDLGGHYYDARPGRKLSGRPALKNKMVRHGLDKDGQLRVIEHADGSEEYWQYFDDRIEATFYEVGHPPSLQTLWPAIGRPEALIFYNQWVMTLRVYLYDEQDKLSHVAEGKWYHDRARCLIELVDVWPEWTRRFANLNNLSCRTSAPAQPSLKTRARK